ncbi:MAG: DNA-processing protein DprA [Thermodesulfovibrionales bacterium]|jgi:DNA processing protein|nr:DNA-processing protein DprA [Thermodesulfovibrionales bacterium]
MSCDDLKYWLALTLIKDIGPVTAKRLLSAFRTPKRVFEASPNELKDVEGINGSKINGISEFNSWDKVEKEINEINGHNVRIIRYTDEEYPESLRHIDDSPVILYVRGSFIKKDKYAVAIVGSRNMTPYGKKVTETIASELALCGITIVSGMARGIDATSHKSALKANGRSIAVLGSGLDNPYPPENKGLFNELSEKGCVISEFPMGTPPNKENFPQRNRLISGLSLGVLVVEAAARSGSLITAGCALDQGKDVFAVPGSITSANSEGTHELIKKGAKLVQKAEDILEDIAPHLKGLRGSANGLSEENLSVNLNGLEINDEEKAICNLLGSEPKHIDIISREAEMHAGRALGILLGLEIKGIVKQSEGKRFYIL